MKNFFFLLPDAGNSNLIAKKRQYLFFPISGNPIVTSQNHKNRLQKMLLQSLHEIQVAKFKNLVKTSKKNFSSRNVHYSNERVLTDSIVIASWIKIEKLLLDGILFKCMGRKNTEDKNISRISTNLTSKIFSTWTKQITLWLLLGLRKNLLFENVLILFTKSARRI